VVDLKEWVPHVSHCSRHGAIVFGFPNRRPQLVVLPTPNEAEGRRNLQFSPKLRGPTFLHSGPYPIVILSEAKDLLSTAVILSERFLRAKDLLFKLSS
jgi:hypothetical protein